MNILDGFEPFVLPHAPACPDSMLLHHVRQAAIEFFSKTHAWRADLAAIVADGTATSFALVLPTGAVVSRLLGVSVTPAQQQPQAAEMYEADEGQERIDEETGRLLAFTDALRQSVTVWPLQANGTAIKVRAVLKPSLAADELPDGLVEQYAQQIARGALATLLAVDGKPWTKPALAGTYGLQFQQDINTAARVAERGFARSGRRTTTKWF